MDPSQISHTTPPFWPGVVGCPALGPLLLLEAVVFAFAFTVVTVLTEREGLFVEADVVERGNGVMEMLGCWFALVLCADDGVVELWIVKPLVLTRPGTRLMLLELEVFLSFSAEPWFLVVPEGKTDIVAPWPCKSWKDFAIACNYLYKKKYCNISLTHSDVPLTIPLTIYSDSEIINWMMWEWSGKYNENL